MKRNQCCLPALRSDSQSAEVNQRLPGSEGSDEVLDAIADSAIQMVPEQRIPSQHFAPAGHLSLIGQNQELEFDGPFELLQVERDASREAEHFGLVNWVESVT